MAKKRPDKKISTFEASFEDVLVCRKNNVRNLMEIFVQAPENVAQENLGTLAGILEITDESPDSSYIVNYLVSVIKKEYFSKTKRGAIESFEAALNKANLALAKLAEHGNVNWLGKIDAIFMVIEKNNIHLSQTGSAKAMLLRGKALTDISEGAQVPENPSPFKTFIDVLSGRLKKNDVLIVATNVIFEIFSFEEIKKSAIKFSPPEFIRFLKTALGNELEKAAVLVARLEEKKIALENSWETSKNSDFNAFSQASFSKNSPKKPKILNEEALGAEEKHSLVKEIKKDLENESRGFVDKKTGHIYIKEDFYPQEKNHLLKDALETIRLKIDTLSDFFKKKIIPANLPLEEIETEKITETAKEKTIQNDLPVPSEEIKEPKKSLVVFDKKKALVTLKKIYSACEKTLGDALSFTIFLGEKTAAGIKIFFPKKFDSHPVKSAEPFKQINVFKKIAPRFSKIKEIFLKLDYLQKIYAALIIIFLLIIPYLIVKIQNRKTEKSSPSQEIIPSAPLPLEGDKNISRIENLQTVFSKNKIFKIVNLNGKIFFISENSLTSAEDQKNYPFPNDFVPLKIVSAMDDLNLIFLINSNGKIISWSPISKKFQANAIEIPSGSDIALAKTYLTYLYLLDKNSNQIYRYPRSGDGFGEKINWLKDDTSLNKISDMAVGENVFLAEDGKILQFFKGKKQNWNIESTTTPVFSDKLYAKRNSSNLYVLDKKNSRVVKLDLNGNIISQFYNSEISNALDFEINEDSSVVYFSSENEVKRFEMK